LPTTIVARLDDKPNLERHGGPDGEPFLFVRCGRMQDGRHTCDQPLARVFSIPRLDENGNRQRVVLVGPGFFRDDKGVFRLTPRASRSYQKDRWLATGNPGTSERLAKDARRRLRNNWHQPSRKLQADQGVIHGQDLYPLYCEQLPGEVACPMCFGINRLDPELLDLAADHDFLGQARAASTQRSML
jgi:hypothetical protein